MDSIGPTLTLRREGFQRLTIAFWIYVVGFAAMFGLANIVSDTVYVSVVAAWFVAWLVFLATLWFLASSFKKSAISCVGSAIIFGPLGVVATYIWVKRLSKLQGVG